MPKRIDWVKVLDTYKKRNPRPSLTDLAKEFHCSREYLTRKANDEEWAVERQRFQERVLERKDEKDIESLAEAGSAFDKQMFQLAQWIAVEAYNERKDNLGKIFEVAKSVEIAQRVGKAALGDIVKPPDDIRMKVVEEVLIEYASAISNSKVSDGNSPEQPVHPSETNAKTG